MGHSGLIRLPHSAWEATLYVGVILQLVVSLFLLTGNYANVRADVTRDIYIVGIFAVLSAVAVAMCLPLAMENVLARRIMLGASVISLVVPALGTVAKTVVPLTMVPGAVLIFGCLLCYRQIRVEEVKAEENTR